MYSVARQGAQTPDGRDFFCDWWFLPLFEVLWGDMIGLDRKC